MLAISTGRSQKMLFDPMNGQKRPLQSLEQSGAQNGCRKADDDQKPAISRVFLKPILSKCIVLIVRGGRINIVLFAEDTVGSGISC